MARWRGWITRALLLLCATVGASGCDEGEIDGVVWQYVWATQMGQTVLNGGAECTPIAKGTDTGASEGHSSWGMFAIHTKSADGRIVERVFIRPAGAPPDFEVTTDNGELAAELELTRSSFEQQEVVEITVDTHEGQVVHVAHWHAEECGELDPPASFELP